MIAPLTEYEKATWGRGLLLRRLETLEREYAMVVRALAESEAPRGKLRDASCPTLAVEPGARRLRDPWEPEPL
jgi:hypothetical protein